MRYLAEWLRELVTGRQVLAELSAVAALLKQTDRVALLLSGKDSIAAGCVCRSAGIRVEVAAYMSLAPGLRCLIDPLRHVADKIGAQFVEIPHYETARMRRWGVLGYPDPSVAESFSYDAVRGYLRKLSGCEWIVEGVRTQEVRQKYHRDRIQALGGMGTNQVCQAIYGASLEWVRAQFRPGGLAHDLGIPEPEAVGGVTNKRHQSGFALTGQHIAWLRDRCQHVPTCLSVLEKQFPFARAAILRRDVYGEDMSWAMKRERPRG